MNLLDEESIFLYRIVTDLEMNQSGASEDKQMANLRMTEARSFGGEIVPCIIEDMSHGNGK